jgi:hypothetical protein
MMPVTKTYLDAGEKDPIALDYMPLSKITVGVTITGGGSMAVECQVTLDDVFDENAPNYVPAASARWHNVALSPTNATGHIIFDGPWRAFRLDIGALTAPIILQIAQSVTPRS